MATIAALSADLSLQSAAFARDMTRARSTLSSGTARMNRSLATLDRGWAKLGRSIGGSIKRLTSMRSMIGILAGSGGIGLLIKKSLDSADAIGKMADVVGVSTDSLQELQFASQQSGVGTEALNKAIRQFSIGVGEALKGTGELKTTIEEYGIALENADGSTRSVDQILDSFADTIQNAKSRTEQLQIAFKAFGARGSNVVNMLRDGKGGLDAFRKEARSLGLVLDESLIRNAEAANDALNRMSSSIAKAGQRILLQLAPAITNISNAIARTNFKKLTDDVASYLQIYSAMSIEALNAKIEHHKEALAGLSKGAVGVARHQRELAAAYGELTSRARENVQATARARLELQETEVVATRLAAAWVGIEQELDRYGFTLADATSLIMKHRKQQELAVALAAQEKASVEAQTEAWRQYGIGVAEASRNLDEMVRDQNRGATDIADSSATMASAFASGTANMLANITDLKSGFRSLVNTVLQAASNAFIKKPLESFFGSVFESMFDGFATGGGVGSGRPIIVGEQGPELFVPSGGGTIVSNGNTAGMMASAGGGGGGSVVYNIDARGAEVGVEQRIGATLRALDHSIEPRAIAAVQRANARNPRFLGAR